MEAKAATYESAAEILDQLRENPQEIRLHCGEMTAQEMRTAKAVLRYAAFKLRALIS